jgi:lipopolysaccharide transport system permease protein
VVDGFRWSVLGGIPPDTGHILTSGVSGLVLLIAGVLYFRRMERTFADIV